MTKYRPPAPANDHPAAFDKGDDFDSLTDAEIEARIAAGRAALGREIQLRILRLQEQRLSRPPAKADKSRH